VLVAKGEAGKKGLRRRLSGRSSGRRCVLLGVRWRMEIEEWRALGEGRLAGGFNFKNFRFIFKTQEAALSKE